MAQAFKAMAEARNKQTTTRPKISRIGRASFTELQRKHSKAIDEIAIQSEKSKIIHKIPNAGLITIDENTPSSSSSSNNRLLQKPKSKHLNIERIRFSPKKRRKEQEKVQTTVNTMNAMVLFHAGNAEKSAKAILDIRKNAEKQNKKPDLGAYPQNYREARDGLQKALVEGKEAHDEITYAQQKKKFERRHDQAKVNLQVVQQKRKKFLFSKVNLISLTQGGNKILLDEKSVQAFSDFTDSIRPRSDHLAKALQSAGTPYNTAFDMSALRKGTDEMGIDNLENAINTLGKLSPKNSHELSQFFELVNSYHESTQELFPKFAGCYEAVGGKKAQTYALIDDLTLTDEQTQAMKEIRAEVQDHEDELRDFATYNEQTRLWSPRADVFDLTDPEIANIIKAHVNGLAGGFSCHLGLLRRIEDAGK